MVFRGFQELLERCNGVYKIYGPGFGRAGEYLQLDQPVVRRLFFDRQSDRSGSENTPNFCRRIGVFGNNHYRHFSLSVLAGLAAGRAGDDYFEFDEFI